MNLFGENGAVFADDSRYRYLLWRGTGIPRVLWIMLNPSKADADRNDPTIRRCLGFTRRWGFSSLEVVNLFAWMATDPRELRGAADPVGPGNDVAIKSALRRAALVVVGWGAWEVGERGHQVARLCDEAGVSAWCLGLTKSGQPRHPLRLSYETARYPWSPR